MRRILTASLVSLVATLQLVSPSLAQDPVGSPAASTPPAAVTGEPLPYADYVAALEAFTQTSPFGEMSDPPTKEEVVAGFENLAAMASDEQVRLEAVIPEECYADAHRELLGYWQSSVEATQQAAAQLEAAASVEEIGPIAAALDEGLRERHPVAYVELDDGSGGFEGSVFNILTALATCEMAPGSAAPESPAPASPAP